MTTKEAIDYWQGVTNLANVLGLKRDAIYKWGEYPPNETQYKLMVLSGGRLSVTFGNDNKKGQQDE